MVKETQISYSRKGRRAVKDSLQNWQACGEPACCPCSFIRNVLRLKHDEAGHMVAAKTINLIRREYFWLTMVQDTQQYCRSCVTCARSCPAPSRRLTRLTLSSQPQEPWQEIAIDIKGPFGTKPSKRGSRYVLAVIDLLTRAAEMIPIPDKSAKTVASAIIRDVFCRRGIPRTAAANLTI